MQYLVSIENTSYYYWQTEILIESFIMHGLEDNLILCVADNNSPKIRGYYKNILNHNKKIIHENFGQQKGNLIANRFFSIRNSIKSGIVTPPFTIIHSDMILKNPIEKYNKQTNIVMNNYGVIKNSETCSYIEKIGLKSKLLEQKSLSENEIENFPFSMPIVFNANIGSEFLDKFFDKLLINLESLLKEEHSPNFPIEKTCWIQTMLESMGFYSASSSFLTCELNHQEDVDVPFIHYKNGLMPIFHKKFFKFDSEFRTSMGPYETLAECNTNPNVDYVNKVIQSYLNKLNKPMENQNE